MSFWHRFHHEDESTFPNVDVSQMMFIRYMGNEFATSEWDDSTQTFRDEVEPWLITHWAEIPWDYMGTLPPVETEAGK